MLCSLRRGNKDALNEENVRRHLERKALTTKELLAKFKRKGHELTPSEKHKMVLELAKIMKKLNPVKEKRRRGKKDELILYMKKD